MQTFLPYSDFTKSARCLDDKRLQNQVKEAAQIMCSLRGGAFLIVGNETFLYSTGGYPLHPATKMWADCPGALCRYAMACVAEMRHRGSKAMKVYEQMFIDMEKVFKDDDPLPWANDANFHAAHRSQLLKKDPEWYGRFGWSEKPGELPYVWPVK